jgi:hypothetical protein
MKNTFLILAVLTFCGTGAFAVVMPTLTAVPATPDIWQQTNGGADLYMNDIRGAFFFIAGIANSPVGDDIYLDGTIKFNNKCELGFVSRADFGAGKTYECSFDPTNGYFNLVKVTGFTTFVNLVNINTHILPLEDSEWRIRFGIDTVGSNVQLTGWLYEADGDLVTSYSYLDDGTKGGAPYLAGQIGTWAFKKSQLLEASWTGMDVSVIPEPATIGLLGLSGLGLVLRRRK